jgi:signal peptidase II
MAKTDHRLAPVNSAAGGGSIPNSRYVLYFGLALLGGAADLLSKQWVFQWRGMPGEQPIWWLWEGCVGVETSLNPGALFGMGAGYSWLFACLSIAAAAGILTWLFIYGAARDRLLTIALGCVTAGIIGNLYDRLGLWHLGGIPAGYEPFANCVRDWILLRYQQHTWPNFNIADSLLVSGAALLVWHAIWFREEKQN